MFIDDFDRMNDRHNLRMINIIDIRSWLCRDWTYLRATRILVVIININQLLSAELMSSYDLVKYRACTFVMLITKKMFRQIRACVFMVFLYYPK